MENRTIGILGLGIFGQSVLKTLQDQDVDIIAIDDHADVINQYESMITTGIVGDITDEYDEEELPYTRLADGVYLFDAKTPTNDFCRLLDIDPSIFAEITQEVDTLSGLFLEIKQELPHRGDVVTYKYFTFEVTAVDKRRILQLKITLPASVGIADVK